jgi:hypothetical protein
MQLMARRICVCGLQELSNTYKFVSYQNEEILLVI